MVFQSYALYPHMTVYDNMAFGMKLGGGGKEEVDKRVRRRGEHAADHALSRPPAQAALRRPAPARRHRPRHRPRPRVFLFDEPLSNLDAALRVQTRIEINKLHERMPDTTMIYVTHDQVEAMTLADRIVVLNAGIVEQVGAPLELYHHPANLFVARFIGSPSMNTVPCIIEAGGGPRGEARMGRPAIVAADIPDDAVGKKGMFGVRPEDLVLTKDGNAIFTGVVDIVEKLGEVTLLYVDCGKGGTDRRQARRRGRRRKGAKVGLTAPIGNLHVFDEKGRAYTRIA